MSCRRGEYVWAGTALPVVNGLGVPARRMPVGSVSSLWASAPGTLRGRPRKQTHVDAPGRPAARPWSRWRADEDRDPGAPRTRTNAVGRAARQTPGRVRVEAMRTKRAVSQIFEESVDASTSARRAARVSQTGRSSGWRVEGVVARCLHSRQERCIRPRKKTHLDRRQQPRANGGQIQMEMQLPRGRGRAALARAAPPRPPRTRT
ncbi:hypothetical protein B0H17DRAFT_1027451 [Mycena rosella]|uniref:Uncharacterized protein n=1 Tax=Mycena rosella TaxID=1033263 RepID=A0AAD7H2Y2_MYCRO|nr:hypothetical protein B0H17DRAFT_1027451 [Mycena rosella]